MSYTDKASARLKVAGDVHPKLAEDEAKARVQLAAAILRMDDAEGLPGRHNLNEQAAVEVALQVYGQALAELIRGHR